MINIFRLNWFNLQAVRFVFSGLFANIIGLIVYTILVLAGIDPIISFTALFWIGVFLTFCLNKKYVFNHHGSLALSAFLHLLVYFIGYFLSASLLHTLINTLNLGYFIPMVVTSLLMPIYFFLMQKLVVFREKK